MVFNRVLLKALYVIILGCPRKCLSHFGSQGELESLLSENHSYIAFLLLLETIFLSIRMQTAVIFLVSRKFKVTKHFRVRRELNYKPEKLKAFQKDNLTERFV